MTPLSLLAGRTVGLMGYVGLTRSVVMKDSKPENSTINTSKRCYTN